MKYFGKGSITNNTKKITLDTKKRKGVVLYQVVQLAGEPRIMFLDNSYVNKKGQYFG